MRDFLSAGTLTEEHSSDQDQDLHDDEMGGFFLHLKINNNNMQGKNVLKLTLVYIIRLIRLIHFHE